MKEHKHYGVYGLILENNNIVLIKKVSGPYDGKLDLPGGSIEFGETPLDALKRELKEEIGIELKSCELIDTDSVTFKWKYNDEILNWQHIGIFYKVTSYENTINENVKLDNHNEDSLGAVICNISELKKEELSEIAILEIEKLGFKLI